jgi:hypothetical protein
MTDQNWSSKDYPIDFPDVPGYAGPKINAPFLHKVSDVYTYVLTAIIPEISRSVEAGAELAGLVLALSLIDYIAGYFVGKQASGKEYISFMDNYFPSAYKAFNFSIYHDLRNGLLHNLAAMNPWIPKTKLYIVHRNNSQYLELNKMSRYLFSVPIFREDIRRAWIMYFHDLIMENNSKPELRINFEKRFNRLGGLGAYIKKIPG